MNVFILTFMEKDCEVRLQPEKAISQVKLQKVIDKYITKQSPSVSACKLPGCIAALSSKYEVVGVTVKELSNIT